MDFGLIPEGASDSLIDLINKAQNAECPSDNTEICCATKFILDKEPKATNNVSALEELLFTAVESANEDVKNLDNENILEPSKSDTKMNPLDNNPSENLSSSLKLPTAVLPFLIYSVYLLS